MQQGYNTGATSSLVMFYRNKYFHSFFSSNFTPTTKDTHLMSQSLRKPKERVMRKKRFVLELWNFIIYNIIFSSPPFKDQVIIINKAQKDCDFPLITFQ